MHNLARVSCRRNCARSCRKFSPGQKEALPDWFTGHVIIPDDKLVNYIHMGYASTYEKYIILKVEKGVVTRKSAIDNAGFVTFRDAQFAAYKKTEEYRSVIAQRAEEDQKGGRAERRPRGIPT